MSKELEAFKRIKDITYDRVNLYGIEEYRKALDTIENALKEYELMKEIRITALFDLAQVNKEHKALEIIKKLPQEEKQVLLNAIYTYSEHTSR